MKKVILLLIGLIFLVGITYAHDEHDEHSVLEQGEAIINAEIPCDSLSDEQLENVGDYIMETMQPGDQHGAMDEMMGGEGSKGLKQAHKLVAKIHYCKTDGLVQGDSDNMLNSISMHNGGMMNMMDGYGMMGGIGMGLWSLIYIAIAGFVFGLTFWWAKKLVVKK